MEGFSSVISAAGKSQGACGFCVGWLIDAPCFSSEAVGFGVFFYAL